MNSIPMQKSPYSSAPLPGSPRHTEAWALTESARRITLSLEKVEKASDIEKPTAKRELRDNIRLNWRLWTIFQAELTLESSDVPLDIRQNMLTLCQYVDKQTVSCLAETTRAAVEPLIGINRNIASGLLGNDQGGAEASVEPPANTGIDTST